MVGFSSARPEEEDLIAKFNKPLRSTGADSVLTASGFGFSEAISDKLAPLFGKVLCLYFNRSSFDFAEVAVGGFVDGAAAGATLIEEADAEATAAEGTETVALVGDCSK